MKNIFGSKSISPLVLASILLSGAAYAGSGNSVLVEQIATSDGGKNTLFIDQSSASNSTVGGVPEGRMVELDLTGLGETELNTLSTSIGQASSVALSDNFLTISAGGSQATQMGAGNTASITLIGNGGQAALEQFGNNNSATILVENADIGVIVQDGSRNRGTLTVSDLGASGELIQIGDDNETVLSVTGTQNARVSFTVQGNGVSTSIPASVVSNVNGQITIVQSQFSTLSSQ